MKPQHKRLQKLLPKPQPAKPFRYIHKSVYVNFKEPKHCKDRSLDFLPCDCQSTKQNKEIHCECYYKDCAENSYIERRDFPKTSVKDAGLKGKGLFAAQDINKGVIVGEYVGEIIDKNEVVKRLTENENFYAISVGKGQYVDATYKGSKMRYVNHSCDPNCESQKWYVGEETHIVLTSLRPISKGAEITFNYMYEDWGEKRQRCYCNTLKCTGWMDGKP